MDDAYTDMLYRDHLLRDRSLVFDVDIRPGWRAVQTVVQKGDADTIFQLSKDTVRLLYARQHVRRLYVNFFVFTNRRLTNEELTQINQVAPSSDLIKIRYTRKTYKKLLEALPSSIASEVKQIHDVYIKKQSDGSPSLL